MVKSPRVTDKCAECQIELKDHPSDFCTEFHPKVTHFHLKTLKIGDKKQDTTKISYVN